MIVSPTQDKRYCLAIYIQAYIEEQRESFEANKEKLAKEAEEAIFKQLSKERQEQLIKEGYFDENGKRLKHKGDSAPTIDCEDYDDKDIEYKEWETRIIKKPLIKTLWNQGGTYNDKLSLWCPNQFIPDQVPVGCVAVAVGQILAYHKKPSILKGREMHWDDMTKIDEGDMFSTIDNYSVGHNLIAKEDIQHLLAHLGDSDLLAMDYKCRGSSSGRALEALHSLGYREAYTKRENSLDIYIEIKNDRPVYIQGCDNVEGCHAWVLDGLVSIQRELIYHSKCPYGSERLSGEYISLIHNNLGWGGYTNGTSTYASGWYHMGIYDTMGEKQSSNTYKSGTPRNYQFNKRIIINIK